MVSDELQEAARVLHVLHLVHENIMSFIGLHALHLKITQEITDAAVEQVQDLEILKVEVEYGAGFDAVVYQLFD